MTPKGSAERAIAEAGFLLTGDDWPTATVGPFGAGAFLVPGGSGELRAVVGQWGLIRPGQTERQPEKRYQSNNARIESMAEKPTFRQAWARGRRCLIPAEWYAEPNWETGRNIWWHLKRADGAPWFLAGLWSEWTDKETGEVVPNFTALTCNCDDHPLLSRLHKPDPTLPVNQQDKRSLIHIEAANWGTWFAGSHGEALRLLHPTAPEVFDQTDALKTDNALSSGSTRQGALF